MRVELQNINMEWVWICLVFERHVYSKAPVSLDEFSSSRNIIYPHDVIVMKDVVPSGLAIWLELCGVYVNLSIVDEEALVEKTSPLHNESRSIPIQIPPD